MTAEGKAIDFSRPYRPKRRESNLVGWVRDGLSRRKSIYMLGVPRFSAVGLRRIYAREDIYALPNPEVVREVFGLAEFSRPLVCMLKMWRGRDGRILVRFHTRRRNLEVWSFELHGLTPPDGAKTKTAKDDACVPETVRDFYEEWVQECFDYPEG